MEITPGMILLVVAIGAAAYFWISEFIERQSYVVGDVDFTDFPIGITYAKQIAWVKKRMMYKPSNDNAIKLIKAYFNRFPENDLVNN